MTTWTPGAGDWPADLRTFWTDRHLCTLTTIRADGRPHVVPVGVALDPDHDVAWVITSRTSRKARHLVEPPGATAGSAGAPVAACQVDGRRWSTLEGRGRVLADVESVRRAEECYAARYRTPRPNPDRVAIRVDIERVLHSRTL